MARDRGGGEPATRRDYMKYGGAVVGGGLLAGCSSGSDPGETPEATGTGATTSTTTGSVKRRPTSMLRR
jgi:iron complex transport system substrate-binding protein